jgi:hypothetical protein
VAWVVMCCEDGDMMPFLLERHCGIHDKLLGTT